MLYYKPDVVYIFAFKYNTCFLSSCRICLFMLLLFVVSDVDATVDTRNEASGKLTYISK